MVQDSNMNNDPGLQFGKILSHPPPGDEVVISGMAGAFPLAANIEEYRYNLENKIEMITQMPLTHPEIPTGLGKMKDITRFDTGFFEFTKRHAFTLNPISKLVLEKCYECIFDAGLHPTDLEGTDTGVFLGMCFAETETHFYLKERVKEGNTIIGNLKSVIPNRISHHLKLKGPSFTVDTACSSSAFALECAFKAIRMEKCSAALVAGANIVLAGGCTLQFARLGVLSADGHCRPFDADGAGYVRAEAVTVILLQKARDSKRIYATVVHAKSNCDGYKEHGITYPSGPAQYNLLKEIYSESEIDPKDISYVEAHGTGTIVGDPEEMHAIDKHFSPGRISPLLVGSVKSSIGHSEPVSGLCALVKVLLAFESNTISPNINYNKPKKTIHGLLQGRLQVVLENTPFRDSNGLVGLSSFGFGGGNTHIILKQFSKIRTGKCVIRDNFPRLVCVSGRTEEAVNVLLEDVAHRFDEEHIALVYNSFRKAIRNHIYRGYAIITKEGAIIKRSVKLFDAGRANFYINFGGLSRTSGKVLHDLLILPALTNFSNRLTDYFSKKKLTLASILCDSKKSSSTRFLNDLLTQLAFVELLKRLEIESKKVLDHSFGKFPSAYFHNFLNLNQCLECLYTIASVIKEAEANNNINGNGIQVLSKYRSKLLSEFQRIVPSPRQVNGFSETHAPATSPEHFVDAIFETTGQQDVFDIVKDSIVLGIGYLSSSFTKRRCKTLCLSDQNDLLGVLDIFGRLYEYGLQPQLQELYPKVEFPVSRGTPMISSKIKWNHEAKHFVPSFAYNLTDQNAMVFKIGLHEAEWASLGGHVVDGRNLFPATGYLYLAWTVLAECLAMDLSILKVVFENCKFKRACSLPPSNYLTLKVMLQKSSGNFEITEGDVPVVTGRIRVDEGETRVVPLPYFGANVVSEYTLNGRDLYKELRLRGYHYTGIFKSLVQCNKSLTQGKIRWSGNWIAFMDHMLQMKILREDTRMLFVPTAIAHLTINPEVHMELVHSLKGGDEEKTVDLPVEINYDSGVIRSGGVEIRGLLASSIARKKYMAVPVLEQYRFVPNDAKLSLEQAVRVFMQVALENNCGFKVKVVELIDEATEKECPPLGPVIRDVLGDLPLVHSDITVLSAEELDVDVNVTNSKLVVETDCTVVIGSKLLSRSMVLREAMKSAKEAGYLISREPLSLNASKINAANLEVFNISESAGEKLIFLRKKADNIDPKPRAFINVGTGTNKFAWLEQLKEAIKKDQDVVAWCQNEDLNGIVGLVNCVRKEPGCQNVRGLFIVDEAPGFEPSLPFYKVQLDKDMGINIYKDGSWGTYRHMLLGHIDEIKSEQSSALVTVRGDLSSFRWVEGPLTRKTVPNPDQSLVEVYYSSLNFKDVLTASGRINADSGVRVRNAQEFTEGFEFAGKTLSGKRVMGMHSHGTLATLIKVNSLLLWEIPDSWSLKDAATVPVVYGTCLQALLMVGKLKPSDSVLIHSGTGGIGQAAINICLHMGCLVFTTVGTEEKRDFIKKNFPQINEKHIGNSRDLSFERMIMKQTKGKGVDVILNSLSEDKLLASARCLSPTGRFLEIGKFDLANNNNLSLLSFRESASFHGIMLDQIIAKPDDVKRRFNRLFQKYIDLGVVRPLNFTVFEKSDIEQAFRFMTTGKHMGKILLEIRKEEVEDHPEKFKGLPRYYCDQTKTYIICGGLGGFGLELADWLILRGARNLVLTSRKGISAGYQNYRIAIWKGYGTNIHISTQDITTKTGCQNLIKEAASLGPVVAIFNLAVVLQDAILPNQTEESFRTSFAPKALATQHLDDVTRVMCPELRDFVVFSSVSCGRGNAGQSNYGMSNSVMERICEKRRRDGYPALAIEWGAIGDVGLVAEMQENHMELEIGGTLQQPISNCLQMMDVLLRQKEAVIVSSMVVAEKKTSSTAGNIIEFVGGVLGIRDMKSVSIHSTLAELGMDSMTGVEVKQGLEREYNIFLSANQIRSITLARIQELQQEANCTPDDSVPADDRVNWSVILKDLVESEEQQCPIVKLRSLSTTKDPETLPRLIAFPGIEGVCQLIQGLTEMLEVQAFGVNYLITSLEESIPGMADALLPQVKQLLKPHQPFHIVAHSWGSTIALEVASRLEKLGYRGTITFIDGSLDFMKGLLDQSTRGNSTDLNVENTIVMDILRIKLSSREVEKTMDEVHKCSTLDEKLKIVVSSIKVDQRQTADLWVNSTKAALRRMKACRDYISPLGKLRSKASLFKPAIASLKFDMQDYGLGQYFDEPLQIEVLGGTHTTILQNKELADSIMKNLLAFNKI